MTLGPTSAFCDDTHFEVEVRRLARLIWPTGRLERSPIVDGRERDAIVQTPDLVQVIEATTSRRKDKIEDDAKKTSSLVRKLRSQGFVCHGTLVTLYEPTAEQELAAKPYKGSIQLLSFDQFLSRLFDAPEYLQLRLNKQFGSIQNPRDAHFELGREYYIPIPILDEESGDAFSAVDIASKLRERSSRFIILADFGSGKSMSLREVFYLLREDFIQKRHSRFPVYVNLRDHAGAKYPDEILERHARDIGLADFSQLVKAWRGGFVDLLLDGFDEFAAMGWSSRPFKLRQIRRAVLEAVRKLIEESPASIGIVIVGRQHYFDSPREMREALCLADGFETLRIATLAEDDAKKIVKRYGGDSVPDWVPSRALLLSYLAAKDFLKDIPELVPGVNPRGHGWDALLKMICEREARQHAAIDGDSVLGFLERLATMARRTNDGLGSFSEDDLSTAFQDTCGFSPDDAARVLISRLPALGSLTGESGRRRFIDTDIADAARAGDVARFIAAPYDPNTQNAFKEALCAIGAAGLDRLSYLAEKQRLQHPKIEVAEECASKAGIQVVALDILQLMLYWNLDYNKSRIDISEMSFESIVFEEDVPDLSRITFRECLVEMLVIGPNVHADRLPRFDRCLIGSLDGIAARGDLPPEVFHECEVTELADSVARNASILNTDLPIATKVLLTVLNKLFNQAGRGRKENAFSRGLEPRARSLVPQILGIVESFGFAAPNRIRNQTIWLPRRDKIRRVKDIMQRPNTSTDSLLQRIRNL